MIYKRSLAVVLLVLLVCSAMAAAQPNTVPKQITYKDSKFPFSLTYPAGWEVQKREKPEFRLELFKGDGHNFASLNVIARYRPERRAESNQEAVEALAGRLAALEAGMKEDDPTTEILSSGRTRLGGQEAFFVKS